MIPLTEITKKTTYQLILRLRQPRQILVGALGRIAFPAGYYIYTGSAKRNMEARLQRHARKNKPLRWHIDYLTSLRDCELVEIKRLSQEECKLNQSTKGRVIVNKFGASDCRAGCGSHLKYIGKNTTK